MKKIDNIYNRSINSLKRHGVIYETTNGKIYKTFKIVYYIASAVSLFMIIAYICGQYIYYSSALNNSAEMLNRFKPTAYLFSATAVAVIIGIILSALKIDLAADILTLSAIAVQLISLVPQMTNVALSETGLNNDYWLRHFIPNIITAAALSVCTYINLKAKKTENRAYKNMIENIYSQNKDFSSMNEDEWNEFLSTYDPRKAEEARRRAKRNNGYVPVFENTNNSDKKQ